METIIDFLSDLQNVAWVVCMAAGISWLIVFAPAFFKRGPKCNS